LLYLPGFVVAEGLGSRYHAPNSRTRFEQPRLIAVEYEY
jgi:hypothetical protein